MLWFLLLLNVERTQVAKCLMCGLWWRWQAQCSTKDIPNSHVPESKSATIGGPYQSSYSERKEDADVQKGSKGLMQSRLTSLYSNGQHKATETASRVEGMWATSFGLMTWYHPFYFGSVFGWLSLHWFDYLLGIYAIRWAFTHSFTSWMMYFDIWSTSACVLVMNLRWKCSTIYVADVSIREPAPKANYTAANFPAAAQYRRLATEFKDTDRAFSPEPEEKINPYSLNRKRPNNPYGAKRKPEKFKKSFREVSKEVSREEFSSDDDSPNEPPPVSFVTAKQKLVRQFEIVNVRCYFNLTLQLMHGSSSSF